MKRHTFFAPLLACALALPLFAAHAAPVDDAVSTLQHDWETIRYQAPPKEREKRFETLSAKARETSQAFADRSEPLVWEGIIVSSWAAERGGMGALSLVKQAKALYEKAIEIDGKALDGSAYASLGVLYHKVPGWPIGFGDKAKAEALFKQALAINPNGIDPNFFYAELLADTGRADQAKVYLDRALAAPARPGRPLADAGRRDEIKALQAKLVSAR
ncbi:MAG: tetratricopeptide repeat protein [Hydrogenophaga sp.]|uniref:tetratricopeptide repeat protein n=1 Tax=Hydrogenophaga sp. TaxID=1904254 RepID=UPI00257DC43D|nr:tetratricopeptide repeat protein [Hydrogenophaga sp.]MBL0943317.1 tetratricopeptide repeat protein [Hydrogenophaga sp.]